MQRDQKFKKGVGFIHSHSSKGLKRPRDHQASDSQSFSSFECNNQRGNRRQDQEFSPYKHPQPQQSWKNHYATNIQGDKTHNTMEYPVMKYPPKSAKHKSDKKTKGQPEQNPTMHRQHKVRSVEKSKLKTCEQQYFKGTRQIQPQKRHQIAFSNQKLRMQYSTFNENSHKIENNEKILKQVNKICERISQIKLDFEFNDSGNFVKKIQSQQVPMKRNNSMPKDSCKSKQRLNKYEQFIIEKQQKQPIIYQDKQQEQFSLGGNSNRKDTKISPQKSPYKAKLAELDRKLQSYQSIEPVQKKRNVQVKVKGCHNPQHRLLMKNNRVSSLDDQSSIEQCLQQDYKQIFTKNPQRFDEPHKIAKNSNGFRNPGVIKTTSHYLRYDQIHDEEDEEDSLNNRNGLIEQYKTSEFNNKGIRQYIENSGKKVHYSNSGKKVHYPNSGSKNNLHDNDLKRYYEAKRNYETVEDKMQEQEGFFQARGGVCFGIDTRNFRQNEKQTDPYSTDGDYLKNRNKYSTNAAKKAKKADPKQQLLKRRQMAKNYDQMARRMVFRN